MRLFAFERWLLAASLTGAVVVACDSGSQGVMDAGDAAAGSIGSSQGGNAPGGSGGHRSTGGAVGGDAGAGGKGGATASGGSSGGVAGATAMKSNHCPGGTPQNAFELFLGRAMDCKDYAFTGPKGRRKIGVALPTNATPGTPYAISFEFRNTPLDMEIWSAPSMCGAAQEKLASPNFGATNGTYCFDLPTTAAYSHLILSVETTFELRSVAFCPATACPR